MHEPDSAQAVVSARATLACGEAPVAIAPPAPPPGDNPRAEIRVLPGFPPRRLLRTVLGERNSLDDKKGGGG